MKHIYEAKFRIDLGKAIPEVGDVANGINTHLSSMGCHEQISIQSDFPAISVEADRRLTPEEEHQLKTIMEATMIKQFPQYDIRLSSFGRKSGNVEQSAE